MKFWLNYIKKKRLETKKKYSQEIIEIETGSNSSIDKDQISDQNTRSQNFIFTGSVTKSLDYFVHRTI